MDQLPDLIFSGAGGGISVGIVFWYFLRQKFSSLSSERNELLKRVKALETTQIRKLEEKIDLHISADISRELKSGLTEIKGIMAKVCDKLDNLIHDNAMHTADIKNIHNYVENVHASLREHREDRSKHAN